MAGNPYDAAGDVVDYEYVVTNTGNVTINALTVTDNRIATVNCPRDDACTGRERELHGKLHHHPGRCG